MLERTGVKSTDPMTSIQWETTFAKISSALNDLPLANYLETWKGNGSRRQMSQNFLCIKDPKDWETHYIRSLQKFSRNQPNLFS